LASICSRVSGGRVLLRPDGSPIVAVGWKEVQGAWAAFLESQGAAKKAA